MTKEELQTELNALHAQKEQALANANALQGAIVAYTTILAKMAATEIKSAATEVADEVKSAL